MASWVYLKLPPPSLLKRMPCALLGIFQAPSDHSPDKKRNMPSQGRPRERASQAAAPPTCQEGGDLAGVELTCPTPTGHPCSIPAQGGYTGTQGLCAPSLPRVGTRAPRASVRPSLPRAGGYTGTQALPGGLQDSSARQGASRWTWAQKGVHLEALSPREKKHCCFLCGMNKSTRETVPPLL